MMTFWVDDITEHAAGLSFSMPGILPLGMPKYGLEYLVRLSHWVLISGFTETVAYHPLMTKI